MLEMLYFADRSYTHSAGGSRVFAKDALVVFDSGPDLAPYRVQRLEPKAGRSFFIADRNAS